MRHDFIDHHSHGESPVHRLHPTAKVLAAAVFLAAAVGVPYPRFLPFLPLAALGLLAALLCRVPLPHLARKMVWPLGLTAATVCLMPVLRPAGDGLVLLESPVRLAVYPESARLALHVVARAAVALAGAVLLVAATPFRDLLRVLESWHTPGLLLRILAVFYRYLFILVDEAEQMELAVSARLVGPAPRLRLLRMAGNMAGTLFLRSLERGETVYQAMCARGFDGRFPTLDAPRWRAPDAATLALAAAAGILTVLLAVLP